MLRGSLAGQARAKRPPMWSSFLKAAMSLTPAAQSSRLNRVMT